MPEVREGWSVAIKRKNGTEFLCASDQGVLPPVWTLSQRKYAVAHKRDLVEHGFDARVVRVQFTTPVLVAGAQEVDGEH
jgi:hypothetical protein